jgi:hypothetical protein
VLIIAVFYAIALLPLHLGLKALFSIIVISYVLWFLSEKIFFTHPRAVNKLVMTELSLCFIQRRDGSTMKANLDSNPVILDNLVILRFRSEAAEHGINKWLGSKSIIITAKMAGPKNFKALKRHLRLAVKRSDP